MMKKICLTLLVLTTIVGCEEESIRSYRAPKQAEQAPGNTQSHDHDHDQTAPAPAASTQKKIRWTLPEGWQEAPTTSSMRVASLVAGEGDQRVEIAITVFAGQVGGVLANINRWRGQQGLPPVASANEQPMQMFEVEGRQTRIVELPGLLAAMIDDKTQMWFVKLVGPPEAAKQQRDAFTAFVQSLQWNS